MLWEKCQNTLNTSLRANREHRHARALVLLARRRLFSHAYAISLVVRLLFLVLIWRASHSMPTVPPPPIRDLEGLLAPVLPAGTRVLGYESEYLTAPGDNYGSTMLAVTVRTAQDASVQERREQKVNRCVQYGVRQHQDREWVGVFVKPITYRGAV